jgi:TRAP-type mannitol/chloroaromatic compound transport system permease small subunit
MEAKNTSMNPVEKKKDTFSHILDILDKISEWAGKIISLLIFPMILVTLVLILGRRLEGFTGFIGQTGVLFNPDEDELPFFTVLISVYFTLGSGYALLTDSFISIDFFEDKLSARAKAWVHVITYLMFFFVFIIIFWTTTQDLIEQLQSMEGETPIAATALMRLEGYTDIWTYVAWPVGMFLLLLAGASRSLRDILFLKTGGNENGV